MRGKTRSKKDEEGEKGKRKVKGMKGKEGGSQEREMAVRWREGRTKWGETERKRKGQKNVRASKRETRRKGG